MAIHMGDPFSRNGDRYEERWPKKPATPDLVHDIDPADSDRFVCDGCHGTFDVDDSIKPSGKKGPMLCPGCTQETRLSQTDRHTAPYEAQRDWDAAASDSTNMSMLENKAIQLEDL